MVRPNIRPKSYWDVLADRDEQVRFQRQGNEMFSETVLIACNIALDHMRKDMPPNYIDMSQVKGE